MSLEFIDQRVPRFSTTLVPYSAGLRCAAFRSQCPIFPSAVGAHFPAAAVMTAGFFFKSASTSDLTECVDFCHGEKDSHFLKVVVQSRPV